MPSYLFIFLVIVIVAVSTIRKCKENERFAVFRKSEFQGLRGPGLVGVIPSQEYATRLQVGARGVVTLALSSATFGDITIPIRSQERGSAGTIVSIREFEGRGKQGRAVVVCDAA